MPKNTGFFPGGTTSACAENTPARQCWRYRLGSYLRVRGEYLRSGVASSAVPELPPRARRILTVTTPAAHFDGTTSAYAENTTRGFGDQGKRWNYLRTRGEYSGRSVGSALLRELPPRARRIPLSIEGQRFDYGTTSACAENTPVAPVTALERGNYLRVRGEYSEAASSRW